MWRRFAVVFTIGYVAKMLGEDEDWLFELSINMFPVDGCLRVYDVGEDGVTAVTEYGIECLQQIIADERAAGYAPAVVVDYEDGPIGTRLVGEICRHLIVVIRDSPSRPRASGFPNAWTASPIAHRRRCAAWPSKA